MGMIFIKYVLPLAMMFACGVFARHLWGKILERIAQHEYKKALQVQRTQLLDSTSAEELIEVLGERREELER